MTAPRRQRAKAACMGHKTAEQAWARNLPFFLWKPFAECSIFSVGIEAGTPAQLNGGRGAGFATCLARFIRDFRPVAMAARGHASSCGFFARAGLLRLG